MEQEILKTVKYLQRSGYRNRSGGISPWMVWAQLDTERSEKTIQRHMLKLSEQGRLMRLGLRSGYVMLQ